jgi:hypothetical protein
MRALITAVMLSMALCASAAQAPPVRSAPASPQNCECTLNVPLAPASAPDTRGTVEKHLVVDVDQAPPDVQAQRVADFTGQLVTATEVLGGATLLLFVIGIVQARMLRQQIKLGRDEFISTNRPRIVLREAYTDPIPGEPIVVTYVLANLGGTKATLLRSQFCIECADLKEPRRQVALDPGMVPDLRADFESGAHGGANFAGTVNAPVTTAILTNTKDGSELVCVGPNDTRVYFFYGRVSYKDERGVERGMAFFRALAHGSYRFVPIGDPQLEYSDTNR